MVTLNNGRIQAGIATKGAELQELVWMETGTNFMWSGDPVFWGKFSPVLFPIVGTVKNNRYSFRGGEYSLSRHGFAREMEFSVVAQTRESCSFLLSSQEATRLVFPFEFEFLLHYTLKNTSLELTYEVRNTGADVMFFSVGAHPAFSVPFLPETTYTDYFLEFPQPVTAPRWPITEAGLIATQPIPMLEATAVLPLEKSLFEKDALVFKQFPADSVTIRTHRSNLALNMSWSEFPFLGIWAAPHADFVCIEPWCGIADSENAVGDFTEKEGIETLPKGAVFTRSIRFSILS